MIDDHHAWTPECDATWLTCSGGTASDWSRRRVLGNSCYREENLTTEDKIAHRLRRNVTIGTRRTSVSLESHLWQGLLEVCERERIGIDELCTEVDGRRRRSTMSSSLRVFLLLYFRGVAVALECRNPACSHGDSGSLASALEAFAASEGGG